MKIALFSDIHGNLPGMHAVFDAIEHLGGADLYLALGDMIGGGPGTEDLLDLLLEKRVRMVQGNYEAMALDLETSLPHIPKKFHPWASATVDWLHEKISSAYWELLANLPYLEEIHSEIDQKIMACHALPGNPWARVCAARAPKHDFLALDAEVIAYGHYHEHHLLNFNGKILINVASVGMRKDGLSAFTLLESASDRWIIQQHLTPYDTAEEARLTREREVPQL
jgi:predicted phosphodiesterase